MAVVGIAKEAPDSPGDCSFELGKYSITRTFLVETNDYNDGPIVVTAAIGIPRLFQLYVFGNEFQPYMRMRRIGSCERLGDGSLWWKVTAIYETPEKKDFGQGTGQETEGEFENPLLELAKVSWSSSTVQIPITNIFDVTTQAITPIKNSAGQIFIPPPNKDVSRAVLTITRNEAITAPHPATTLIYQDTVNSDVFWGAAPGQVKCMPIKTSRQVKQLPAGNFVYLECEYEFHFLANWDLQLLDTGDYYNYQKSMSAPIIKKPFLDSSGNPIQGLLDGTGNALGTLDANGDVIWPQTGNPVFLTVRPYTRLPFAALNLPQSFNSGVQ